ncbi:Hemerythrin HHE cation binding domain-containing protein [Paenibacillus sp. UNCCL117]|uniref:hemerythrin domain-containing protein n=1 Tax=unclassified Paenibacillus TaxID=185978 RepID=UPI0008822D2E|nr:MULTISPECIES: hemerythrin domain-containing protein [unclassified Paenibacillus]SDC17815.1 Hemerythrin HHE cation binding domain-containing protein [Paenibacillus sp. cl123]SFW18079.1 Hemerythrin HHE cation binding domain-containing protein [Paenibacillus sp. UNCCL117]
MQQSTVEIFEQSARPTQFMEAIERLKEEHNELRARLSDIRGQGERVSRLRSSREAEVKLKELRDSVGLLMESLDAHASWEERELFPMLTRYFNKMQGPSIMPSIWVMEKDHELAHMFVQSFYEAVDGCVEESENIHVKTAASHLIQACMILSEHLNLEEEVVYPMADQILTDIDSLFS